MTDARFTDEDLTAFLDGEAAADIEAAIAEALETDDALAERLASLDLPLAAIRESYDVLLSEAPPMPSLPEKPAGMRPAFGAGLFGVGLAAGLAVATFFGFGQTTPQAPGWKAVVADYQVLYGADTLDGINPTPDEALAQLRQVGSALNLALEDLPTPEGLTFRRAQILEFNGRPLAQIAFTRDDGTPLALCILASNKPATPEMDVANLKGLGSVSWQSSTHGYILIGGSEAETLRGNAATFRDWSTTAS